MGYHFMLGILIFFKLCVYDCGCLLRVDDVTVEKEQFDYARVLIATTSLEVINISAKIMVDGVIFDFKIIEEWGFSLGEDACLFDEDDTQEVDKSGTSEHDEAVLGSGEVNELLQQLSEDWSKEADLQDKGEQPYFEVDIGNNCDRDAVLATGKGSIDACSLLKPNAPICGATCGLLTLWDVTEVEVWSSMSFEHVLVLIGRFLHSEEHFVLFNVYAPSDVTCQ